MKEIKEYLEFNASSGYPAGDKIFYECLMCGSEIPSMPAYAAACKCRNVIVDVDAGRVSVKDPSKFRMYFKQ